MPLIIAPIDNLNSFYPLVKAGADMLYAGVIGFARKEKNALDFRSLEKLCALASEKNVKILAAFNRVPPIISIGNFLDGIKSAKNIGIHGFILNDPGLIAEVRNKYPEAYIMASVGLSPLNWKEVEFICEIGANTVLLPEFLEVDEIKLIKEKINVALEFFAYGLMEFGYTGKCLLSSYNYQKNYEDKIIGSAKRGGTCSHICRAPFSLSGTPRQIFLRYRSYMLNDNDIGKLIPYIDIFKIWKGTLKENELCNIIIQLRKKISHK